MSAYNLLTHMKLNLRLTILATLITSFAFSQTQTPADTSYWSIGGVSSITLSQVSLTNWAAGGENQVAINGNFSIFANRVKGRGKWENSMDIFYGLLKQGDGGFTKSDDQLNIVTKYSYKVNNESGKWFYSALLDFKTQFAPGFATPAEIERISDFMAPGFLVIGLGVSYDPNDKLSFSYQPLTGKFTFVNDDELAAAGAFGVDPGKNTRAEFGSFFRAKYKDKNFESKLELFTGYTENVGEIDVNWQNALVVQLTKVLSANVFTQLIYDEDVLIGEDNDGDGEVDPGTEKARVQFKSVLGVGLTYSFGAKKPE